MALSITGIVRDNGPACDHVTVTVNHEGTTRTFKTSYPEIDLYFQKMTPLDQLQLLVTLWAKYRRANARTVLGVDIA